MTTLVDYPAHLFACAWLNVAHAASDDGDRPALFRAVHVGEARGGLHLLATDSYKLLRTLVPRHDGTDDFPHPHPALVDQDDLTDEVIVGDPDQRMKALMTYVRKATKKDPDARLRIGRGTLEDDDRPTLSPDLDRPGLVVETDSERLVLPILDMSVLSWGELVATNPDPDATQAIGFGLEVLGSVTKVDGEHVQMFLDGTRGAIHVQVDAEPPVVGIVMPYESVSAGVDLTARAAVDALKEAAGPGGSVTISTDEQSVTLQNDDLPPAA